MQRALYLAALGGKAVRPNPLVGAVLVHNDTIIGEGFHRQYGGPHAEVNAVNAVADKDLLPQSTLYVTLEPCNHFGKTPPCTELIINKGIKNVIVAVCDPNPLVSGSGIQRLESAGIKVKSGLLASEAMWQNRVFFCAQQKKRPFIILKWAQSKEGNMATADRKPVWLSNKYSRKLVHKWRSDEDAIMVGPGTLLYDNPRLTNRDWPGSNPIRVSYSLRPVDLEIKSKALQFFNDEAKSIFYHTDTISDLDEDFVQLNKQTFFQSIFEHLYQQGVQSVIIEGGAGLFHHLIAQNLWDEARVFITEAALVKGLAAPRLNANVKEEMLIAGDRLMLYTNPAAL